MAQQDYLIHTIPAFFMLEARMPEEIIDSLQVEEEKKKIIEIEDNGIGMSRQDLIEGRK